MNDTRWYRQWRQWGPEVAVLLVFAAFAAAVHLARTERSRDFLRLGTEAGNLASVAAARDHPECFAGDELLGNPDDLRFGRTLHVTLTRLLARVTGHYGNAGILLYGLHVFLLLTACYVLGRVWTRDRWWALLFAFVCLPEVAIAGLGDGWGAPPDPLPRFAGHIVLVVLWALAVAWRERPGRWPWLMAGAGLLMYVDPVSGAVAAGTLWCGWWGSFPDAGSWGRRIGYRLALGGGFLLLAAPTFLAIAQPGPAPVGQSLYPRLEDLLAPAQLDPLLAEKELLRVLVFSGLLPLALAALVVLWRLDWPEPSRGQLLGRWAAGVLVATLGLQSAIWHMARQPGPRRELDLVYVVPLLWLLVLKALAAAEARPAWPPARWLALVGVALAALWFANLGHGRFDLSLPAQTWHALRRPAPVRPADEAVCAAAERARGRRVLPVGVDPLALRYGALCAVVYCWQDGATLARVNCAALPRWYGFAQRMRRLEAAPWDERKVVQLTQVAEELQADYLLVNDVEVVPALMVGVAETVWRNEQYALLRLLPPPVRTGAAAMPAPSRRVWPLGECGPGLGTDTIYQTDFATPAWSRGWDLRMAAENAEVIAADPDRRLVPLADAALRITCVAGDHYGTSLDFPLRQQFGVEPEELYFRYYLRFGDDWHPNTEGKLPGLGGTYDCGGWGLRRVTGRNGWSARGYFHPRADGTTGLGFYCYHAEMREQSGDIWWWDEQPAARLANNRWYCVEHYVKLNTPGQHDGALRAWVDGQPVFERGGLRLRDFAALKIEAAWVDVYFGGREVVNETCHLYLDRLAMSSQYIGPDPTLSEPKAVVHAEVP